jgi:hypothetical protein
VIVFRNINQLDEPIHRCDGYVCTKLYNSVVVGVLKFVSSNVTEIPAYSEWTVNQLAGGTNPRGVSSIMNSGIASARNSLELNGEFWITVTTRPKAAIGLLGLTLYLGGACRAQNGAPLTESPSTGKIENLLSSGYPRLVAWGAHYAVTTKDQGVVPQLTDLAEHWPAMAVDSSGEKPDAAPNDQTDQHDAMAAVLDAIIQLQVAVAPATLRNLAGDFPNQVAILLSRVPLDEGQSLSQEFYHSDPKTRGAHNLQYVSAALLAQDPPEGFVADLFSGIHNHATITIIKPGYSQEGLYGSGVGECCVGEDLHRDWPLFGVYQLSKSKAEGYFVLLTDPDPIYAERSETRHEGGCENFTFLVLGPEQRRRFVARWLGKDPSDLEWETEVAHTIVYLSDEQFYGDLLRFIAHEQEKYRATGSALVMKNLMTVSEQEEPLPYLDLSFKDQRGSDAVPIPEPNWLPPRVSWPKQE